MRKQAKHSKTTKKHTHTHESTANKAREGPRKAMPCVAIGARDEEEEEEVPEAPRPSLKVLFANVDEVLNHSLDPRALRLDEDHTLKIIQDLKRS